MRITVAAQMLATTPYVLLQLLISDCSHLSLLSPGRIAGSFSQRKEEAVDQGVVKPGRGKDNDPLEPSPSGVGAKTVGTIILGSGRFSMYAPVVSGTVMKQCEQQ
jgi:hypothetical protein